MVVREEMKRLIDTIPTVDPTSRDYEQLLRNIEMFSSVGLIINDMDLADEVTSPRLIKADPVTKDYAIPDEQPEVFAEDDSEEELSKADVRKMLTDFRRETGMSVPAILRENFDVDTFDALPAKSYSKLVGILKKKRAEL